ncbi:hypothetical protein F5Y10DRAFT_177589 [Nemania abortiva]|nr:hypothetical protein F5Y10DRAFT_177589 [Nemania abortiva]
MKICVTFYVCVACLCLAPFLPPPSPPPPASVWENPREEIENSCSPQFAIACPTDARPNGLSMEADAQKKTTRCRAFVPFFPVWSKPRFST